MNLRNDRAPDGGPRSARGAQGLARRLRSIAVALCLAAISVLLPAGASPALAGDPIGPCTQEDRDYAASMGLGSADEAYAFGLEIQEAVEARDSGALFDLVAGELNRGPRRQFVQGKPFAEIFSEEWRQQVLATEPGCQPVGWRGFMLGSGWIWYSETDGRWSIVSINGAAVEPIASNAWVYRDTALTRACFTTPWLSLDNYEEYRDQYEVDDDFDMAPGLYLGGAVPLEPIRASWGDELSLAVDLSHCGTAPSSGALELTDGWVRMTVATDECTSDADPSVACPRYRLVRSIPEDRCAILAPNLADSCRAVGLVEIADPTGGTMGDDVNVAIFGIIDSPVDGEPYIVPLANFDGLNDALNYVDALAP